MENQILNLIENKQYVEVKNILSSMLVPDIANIFENLDTPNEMIKIFRLIPKDLCAEVFSYMDSDIQETLVQLFTDTELRFIIDDMYLDDTIDFIEEMPANVVDRILKKVSPENRKEN